MTSATLPDTEVSDAGDEPTTDIGPSRTAPTWARWLVLGALVAVALGVRWHFHSMETMDYRAFLSRWYETLDTQGFGAFKEQFADYNYPYLYLIWLLTVVHAPTLIGIKALSVTFDLVLGFFAYRIVALRTDRLHPCVPWLSA
ncbi:hypothetical protein GOPIP_054_00790 [Gordonia polyisoprenivorans NBRC 16320 = JCM 10675]|nr:hypothetical protein GOPIP_054_00790 [Gordonia polyisoprenivorans NBRC 16320 = JCM 10675]